MLLFLLLFSDLFWALALFSLSPKSLERSLCKDCITNPEFLIITFKLASDSVQLSPFHREGSCNVCLFVFSGHPEITSYMVMGSS